MKNLFWQIHRYVGLILAPIFALILITGLILAIGDMKSPDYSQNAWGSHAEQIMQTVETLQQNGVAVSSVYQDAHNPQLVWVQGGKDSQLAAYSIDNASFVKNGGMDSKIYNTAKGLHKNLLFGKTGKLIMEIAAWAMAGLILIGLFFMVNPKFSKSLISWHNAIGVLLLPIWLMLPVTAVMMSHHWYFGAMPKMERPQGQQGKQGRPNGGKPDALPVMQILNNINEQGDLANVVSVAQAKFGTVITMSVSGSLKQFSVQKDGSLKENPPMKPNYVRMLHLGEWAGKSSKPANLAIGGVLFFLLLSGVYTYIKRTVKNAVAKNARVSTGNILVLYASQTGNAEKLAFKTAQKLNQKGVNAQAVPMLSVTPETLKQQQMALFLCSTAGDGELPDNGKALEENLRQTKLGSLKYAFFALGNSGFKNFCGGGKKLDATLKSCGASEIMPIKCADGTPDTAWQEWFTDICQHFGVTVDTADTNAPKDDVAVRAVLIQKTRLDNPETTKREAWELLFRLPENVAYQGGDLLMITPPNSQTPRSYSVGSSSDNSGLLRLTVGMNVFTNDKGEKQLGKCSSYLINDLAVGDEINAVLRYTDFHIENNDKPVIMVASGVGIAPMIGFLADLQKRPRPAWLFFGNSNRIGGYHYQNQWEKALSDGVLTHINVAFTEEHKGYYVQDELFRNGHEVFDWVMNNNALIYVCGKTNTVGKGVTEALVEIIKAHGKVSRDVAVDTVNKLKANNRIKMDLFG
ncbi:MAG: PepSY domain-containing protein [Neisseriaceae bacterium]|nr:PepSY domain-containing protein [Neisseriaceae bacterium]